MAASMYGPDLGSALKTAETIKGQRLQNQLSRLKLGQAQGAEQRSNALGGLRQKAVGGDVDAKKQLLAMDPENGPKILDALAKMSTRKREETRRGIDRIGQMTATIQNIQEPQKQARMYEMLKQEIPSVQWPEQYDPAFMEFNSAKAMTMDQILSSAKGKGGKDGGGMTRADESEMGKQITRLFGGFYNPTTGEYAGMEKGKEAVVQSIQTEAARLFKAGKADTISKAVTMAARKKGIKIEDLSGGTAQTIPGPGADPDDPFGIR